MDRGLEGFARSTDYIFSGFPQHPLHGVLSKVSGSMLWNYPGQLKACYYTILVAVAEIIVFRYENNDTLVPLER